MQAIHMTNHAVQRAEERGMPPFILRKAAVTATYRGHGDCIISTKYGFVVIDHETVATVLAPNQKPKPGLKIITI